MGQRIALPRCGPNGPDRAWADRLVQSVQNALDAISTVVPTGIVVANTVVPPAAFDPTTATPAQTAQAFATLLQGLQKAGTVR